MSPSGLPPPGSHLQDCSKEVVAPAKVAPTPAHVAYLCKFSVTALPDHLSSLRACEASSSFSMKEPQAPCQSTIILPGCRQRCPCQGCPHQGCACQGCPRRTPSISSGLFRSPATNMARVGKTDTGLSYPWTSKGQGSHGRKGKTTKALTPQYKKVDRVGRQQRKSSTRKLGSLIS